MPLTGVLVAVNATWLVFGAAPAGLPQHERLGRIANLVFAVLLVAAVVTSVFL